MNKEELQLKLKEYNGSIRDLIDQRTKFLDEHMHLFAEFQIGDELEHINGKRGKCIKHYRHRPSELYDTSFECDCEIQEYEYNFGAKEKLSNLIDNTSHYGFENPWFKVGDEEAKRKKSEYVIRSMRW